MPLGARLALLGAGLTALGLTSCPARGPGAPGDLDEGVAPEATAAREVAAGAAPNAADVEPRETSEALDPGSWPDPSQEDLAELSASAGAAQGGSSLAPSQYAYQRPTPSIDPEKALVAIARETYVFQRPSWRAKKLGYLRAGAVVERSVRPAGHEACAQGWYEIEPEGFVCVGKMASLDLNHPIAQLSSLRPDRERPLPYPYGRSRFPTPPFYTKVPTPAEQRRVELELNHHLAKSRDKSWQDVELTPVPELLRDGAPSFTWGGGQHSSRSLYTGRALVQSGFAFLSLFESEGRKFGLSIDLDVMPLDRLTRVEASSFSGLALDDDITLPVAFTQSKGAFLYEGDPRTTGLKPLRQLSYREAVPITEKRVRVGGVSYWLTPDGHYLRDEHLVRVDAMKKRPGWAVAGRTWIDVSILRQSLVAYEGTKPVYVTLVSTGADGLGDPEETHSTIRGQFLIHTKHVTATMSGDEVGDEFDLRDVPYVQYFTEGYALHAAYWHDSFGRPRSHGCINLSPEDARWLFAWTDPQVPDGWHGALSLHNGTLVHVHP